MSSLEWTHVTVFQCLVDTLFRLNQIGAPQNVYAAIIDDAITDMNITKELIARQLPQLDNH